MTEIVDIAAPAGLRPSPVGMRTFSAAEIAEALRVQRAAFLRDGPPSLALRRNRIDRLAALAFENAEAIADAVSRDFGNRPHQTTMFCDILGILTECHSVRRSLGKWMKPRSAMGVTRPLGVRTSVQAQPLGVVGIVAPWNFPVNLFVMPALGALAAGNRVLFKAPEAIPRTANLLQELVAQYFSPEELTVITGGPDTGAAFCAMAFDHLLFTGSPDVGKRVQRSAADNLVPVTLELGGKNPAVVGRDADIDTAAGRIARGRLINSGQVCLCPDYVFVPTEHVEKFVTAAERQFRRCFPTVAGNPDYCTIVDDKNYARIVRLIDDARAKGATAIEAAPEGESLPSPTERRIAPTILTAVNDDMAVMHEEVFGPVLSVLPYAELNEVIDYVNARPAPLASYWFGRDSGDFRRFCARTRSGGIVRNDIMLQAAIDGAPLGGVGNSGMGAYHGKAGFDTFSHYRTVCESRLPGTFAAFLVPPIPSRVTAVTNWAVAKQAGLSRRRIDRYARGAGG